MYSIVYKNISFIKKKSLYASCNVGAKKSNTCIKYYSKGFTFTKLSLFCHRLYKNAKTKVEKRKRKIHSITLNAQVTYTHVQRAKEKYTAHEHWNKEDSTARFEQLSISCCGILIKQQKNFAWKMHINTHTHSQLGRQSRLWWELNARTLHVYIATFSLKMLLFLRSSLSFFFLIFMLRIISGFFVGNLQTACYFPFSSVFGDIAILSAE